MDRKYIHPHTYTRAVNERKIAIFVFYSKARERKKSIQTACDYFNIYLNGRKVVKRWGKSIVKRKLNFGHTTIDETISYTVFFFFASKKKV